MSDVLFPFEQFVAARQKPAAAKIREQVKLAKQEIGAAVNNGIQTVKLQIELLIKYPDGRTVIKQINEAQIAEGRILLEILRSITYG